MKFLKLTFPFNVTIDSNGNISASTTYFDGTNFLWPSKSSYIYYMEYYPIVLSRVKLWGCRIEIKNAPSWFSAIDEQWTYYSYSGSPPLNMYTYPYPFSKISCNMKYGWPSPEVYYTRSWRDVYLTDHEMNLFNISGSGEGTVEFEQTDIYMFEDDDTNYDVWLADSRMEGFISTLDDDWLIETSGSLPTRKAYPKMIECFDPEGKWLIDDDIPFRSEFPELIESIDIGDIWLIDDDLPFRYDFPELIESIDNGPTTSWLQYAGYIPYRPWPGKVSIPNIIEAVELPDIDWTRSMQQTFEYYTVDPRTWYDQRRLDQVMSSNHSIDLTSEMRGSATLNTTEQLPESYIRTYMRCKQDGVEQRVCLGTYLYMTSQCQFDGIKHNYTMTGYTPLVELQESLPPLGYFIYGKVKKGSEAPLITEEIRKAIVNNTRCELEMNVQIAKPLLNNFVAGTSDNWLTVVNNLLSASNEAKYMLTVDEWGSLQLKNSPSVASMQPKFVYDDGNASILLPSVDTSDDLFSIPNAVELIFVGNTRYRPCRVVVKNEDESSPVSVQNRGREITKRYTINNIAIPTTSNPTEEVIRELVTSQAYTLLETLSTVQKTISYSHGYCGTKVGDCVMINYVRAGLENIKAVITSQKINCTPGCQVDETAVYTKKYWRRSDGNAAND